MNAIHRGLLAGIALALALATASCGKNEATKRYEAEQKRIAANLANFDDLDFNVFTNQKWDELTKSHSKDIKVHWPDGHTTDGIEKHTEDLKAMFVWMPDMRIKTHPIKIAQGDWTAVVSEMEGTFSQPMPLPDGKSIPPTGKSLKMQMVTIGHWTPEGTMDEEYLFWDNKEFMKQIGLGQ